MTLSSDHSLKGDVSALNEHTLKLHAARGLSKPVLASKFNMYESEFDQALKKNKTLQKAYDMGVCHADEIIHNALWGMRTDPGILLLLARMRLRLEDPVLEALTGNVLKTVLSKMDTKAKKTLSGLLKLK